MLRLPLSIVCITVIIGLAHGSEPERRAKPDSGKKAATVLATFDVPQGGDLLLIPVELAGKKTTFVLDTGAALTAVDQALANDIGPLKVSSQPYPKGYPEIYELPQVRLAGSELSIRGDAAILDLSMMRAASGYDVQGIIGMDFLQKYVVRIDCDQGKVWFLNSNPHKSRGVKLTRDEYLRPVLPVQLAASQATPMVIDTGMIVPGIGELNAVTFSGLVDNDRIAVMSTQGRVATVSGEATGRKGRLKSMRLDGFEHLNIGVREGTLNALGLDYLSRYILTFDFPNNLAYLEKGGRYGEPTAFDMSGLVILREDGKTAVARAHVGSPAHKLGIRNGDLLLKLNGRHCSDHSMMQIRRTLAKAGQNVTLSVDNGFAVMDYDLRLSDWQNSSAEPRSNNRDTSWYSSSGIDADPAIRGPARTSITEFQK